MLWIAYGVSFVDRQILSLLVEPIRVDLGLSDTDLGFLQGVAFGLFYVTLSVPIGWFVDRGNRRNILIAGVLLWSVATAACGFATGFWSMFVARMLVGVGEAVLSPCAVSLLSDYFPREQRAVPMSVYVSAGSFGGGLALIAGGAVLGSLDAWASGTETSGWRMAFIVVGLPGVLVAAMMFTFAEPPRQVDRGYDNGQDAAHPLRLGQYLRIRRRLLVGQFGGFAMLGVVAYAVGAWSPTLFMRVHEWNASTTGLRLGLGTLIGGVSGAVSGGFLAIALRRRGCEDASLRAAALSLTLLVPMTAAAALGSASSAVVLFGAGMFFTALASGVSVGAIGEATPNNLRGRVTAIYYLSINLVGLTIGPLSVAVITERVFANPKAIGYSMAIVTIFAGTIAIGLLWWALPAFRAALASPGLQGVR